MSTFKLLLLSTAVALSTTSCSGCHEVPRREARRNAVATGISAPPRLRSDVVAQEPPAFRCDPSLRGREEAARPQLSRVQAPVRGLEIRWTEHVALRSLRGVDRALARRHPRGLGEFALWDLVTGQGPPVKVSSCQHALELRTQGYEPRLPVTFKGSIYLPRCRPLVLLAKAKAAQQSYLSDFRLEDLDFDLMPAQLATAVSPTMVERRAAVVACGGSWRGFVPSVHVRAEPHARAHRVRVGEESLGEPRGNGTLLEILAWADFDHDGWEDVLLYVVNGSGRIYSERLVILTRRSATGRFEMVSSERR